MDDFDGFFFLAYSGRDRKTVTVVDLMFCVSYERHEWDNVNDNTYDTAEEAIKAGRDLAKRHNLSYEPFDSRYGNENEVIEENENENGYIY